MFIYPLVFVVGSKFWLICARERDKQSLCLNYILHIHPLEKLDCLYWNEKAHGRSSEKHMSQHELHQCRFIVNYQK